MRKNRESPASKSPGSSVVSLTSQGTPQTKEWRIQRGRPYPLCLQLPKNKKQVCQRLSPFLWLATAHRVQSNQVMYCHWTRIKQKASMTFRSSKKKKNQPRKESLSSFGTSLQPNKTVKRWLLMLSALTSEAKTFASFMAVSLLWQLAKSEANFFSGYFLAQ